MNRKERRAAAKRTHGGDASWFASTFAQAVMHHERGEYLAAEACCRAILVRDQKHVGALNLLGVIAQHGRRFEEAAGYFRNVIKLNPGVVLAHYGVGNALAALGRFDEAATALERALAMKRDDPAAPVPDEAQTLLGLGFLYEKLGKPERAVKLYERAVALKPDFAEAHNSLATLLLAQGRHKDASGVFARALALAPELFASFADIVSTLFQVEPALREAVQRAAHAWPRRVPAEELLGPRGLAAIADDPLLHFVLESTTVRDIALEKFLTCARATLLDLAEHAADTADATMLDFCCALARQCFINEYVFADTPEEIERVERLKQALTAGLKGKSAVPALWLAAAASYFPLNSLPDSQLLLERSWPQPAEDLLTQQIREVEHERQLRESIPHLTEISDSTSRLVRQQYEENPYPRWILASARRTPASVDEYFRRQFPLAVYRPLGTRDVVEILVAGCGTGEHPVNVACRFLAARVLAVDLSLSSLCYAMRKTREMGLNNIDYAQADILQLQSLGRSFDIIDSIGVLHHLGEPREGWRRLLALLRPDGLMRVGLYSEIGRADVVAARHFIAERGFQPTAAGIRRCRQELLDTPLHGLTRYHDFFTISECRDLLFHVQEHRFTIRQIGEFLASQNLRLIGFELDPASQQAYRARYPDDPSMTNLDCWNAFENERPQTFAAMYQFWVQKA
jgi:tetratricopeptide (TPR) repeat protein/SAM-dependent methyltransferase